jgi:hypothetical protein
MEHALLTPQLAADLLLLSFFAVEVLRWRRNWLPVAAANRGTATVFWGCYLVALFTLNWDIPSPVALGPEISWLGVAAASAGLCARIAATINAARRGGPPEADMRHSDQLGRLVLWIGAASASANAIAALTVAVAMLAATGVLASDSRERSLGDPRPDER